MSAPELKLRRLSELPSSIAAPRLSALAQSWSDVISRDDPGIAQRYATSQKARAAIEAAQQREAKREGRYLPFAVIRNEIIGMATVEQLPRWRLQRRWPFLAPNPPGPVFSLWLGHPSTRQNKRGLMPDIMHLLALQMTEDGQPFHGRPWTLVAPDHTYAQGYLSGSDNAFGGFNWWGPWAYPAITGNDRRYHLWRANLTVAEMRVRLRAAR